MQADEGFKGGFIGEADHTETLDGGELARQEGLPLLVRFGHTGCFETRNGHPFSESERGTAKTCVHTKLVALWFRSQSRAEFNVHAEGRGENISDLGRDGCNPGEDYEEPERQGEGAAASGLGDREDKEERRTSGEGDAGTAEGFWADNPTKFRKHVPQLLKSQSVYRFSVKGASYPDLAEPIKFEVYETRCTTCEIQYRTYRSKDATLAMVTMMGSGGVDVTQVEIERKGCAGCGMDGWASDNWRETGVFNVNNLPVHLHVYYEIRPGVQAGIPTRTSLNRMLGSRRDGLDWIARNEVLAERCHDQGRVARKR